MRSSFGKFLAKAKQAQLWQRLEASEGDLVLLVADTVDVARASLGALRRELARRLDLIPPTSWPGRSWSSSRGSSATSQRAA